MICVSLERDVLLLSSLVMIGLQSPRRNDYHFAVVVESLELIDPLEEFEPPTAKFAVYKGPQLFNQTQEPIVLLWSDGVAKIAKCQLSFYLRDFNPNRRVDFVVKMKTFSAEQKMIEQAQFDINSGNYVSALLSEGSHRADESVELGNYVLKYRIFTEKNRFDLERAIKEFRLSVRTGKEQFVPLSKGTVQINSPILIEKKLNPTQRTPQSSGTEVRPKAEEGPQPFVLEDKQQAERGGREQPKLSQTQSQTQPQSQPQPNPSVTEGRNTEREIKQSQKSPKPKTSQRTSPRTDRENKQFHFNPSAISHDSGAGEPIRTPRLPKALNQISEMRSSGMGSVAKVRNSSVQSQSQRGEWGLAYIVKVCVFFLVSLLLIYQVMLPTRRVSSRAQKW